MYVHDDASSMLQAFSLAMYRKQHCQCCDGEYGTVNLFSRLQPGLLLFFKLYKAAVLSEGEIVCKTEATFTPARLNSIAHYRDDSAQQRFKLLSMDLIQ